MTLFQMLPWDLSAFTLSCSLGTWIAFTRTPMGPRRLSLGTWRAFTCSLGTRLAFTRVARRVPVTARVSGISARDLLPQEVEVQLCLNAWAFERGSVRPADSFLQVEDKVFIERCIHDSRFCMITIMKRIWAVQWGLPCGSRSRRCQC